MKHVYIKAFSSKNLGDDIFIKILADRYNNVEFSLFSTQNYEGKLPKNIRLLNNIPNRICNKVLRMFYDYYLPVEKKFVKECDMIVQIGGSLFMENTSRNWRNNAEFFYKKLGKKYYILGSNFGPYNTDEYLNYYKNIFGEAQDVCFREKYSYDLFKELSNVRWASDIVFSLDTSNIVITNNRKVVISVIDCKSKTTVEDKENYESKIIELCEYFIEKKYEVILMSYCKLEHDEETISSILSKCNNKIKNEIKTYCYDGDIEEALNIMGDCQIIIGSRFHANIIGLLLGKTIIPIAYSDKTINILNDINFKGRVLKVQEIQNFSVDTLTEKDLTYKHDISYQIKNSQKQFEILDKILKE